MDVTFFKSKPFFESCLQGKRENEASKYLDVFRLEESSHVPPMITSIKLIVKPSMLTIENIDLSPSLLPIS